MDFDETKHKKYLGVSDFMPIYWRLATSKKKYSVFWKLCWWKLAVWFLQKCSLNKSRLDQNYGCTLYSMWIKRPFHFQHSEGVKSRIFLSFQRYPKSFTLLQKKEVKSATQLEYDVFLFQTHHLSVEHVPIQISEYLNLRSHSYERESLFLTYLPFERGSSIPNYR